MTRVERLRSELAELESQQAKRSYGERIVAEIEKGNVLELKIRTSSEPNCVTPFSDLSWVFNEEEKAILVKMIRDRESKSGSNTV